MWKLTHFRKALHAGRLTPPEDGRKANGNKDLAPSKSVDNFFFYMYEFVAEPLAETGDSEDKDHDYIELCEEGMDEEDKVGATSTKCVSESDLGLEGVVARLAHTARRDLPVKWLGHIEREELYEHYQYWHLGHAEGKPASRSTFRTVMRHTWRGIIKIRALKHHAQCHECARISALRDRADTQDEKMELQERRQKHLNLVFADRATDDKQNVMARMSAKRDCALTGRLIKLDLDGMDQAKFKIPRNVVATKLFDKGWRPQMHFTGVVLHGIAEVYFALDADQPKDSNAQRTILCRALEIAQEVLSERGLDMPQDWVFHVGCKMCPPR